MPAVQAQPRYIPDSEFHGIGTNYCRFGCGQIGKYVKPTDHPQFQEYQCAKYPASCPAVIKKNAEKVALAHAEGRLSTDHFTFEDRSKGQKGKLRCDEAWFSYHDKPHLHRTAIKNKLIAERGHVCEDCKLAVWKDKPITLELEHVDGDGRNHVRENLKLLCPNCHSYTPTWRRKKTLPQ